MDIILKLQEWLEILYEEGVVGRLNKPIYVEDIRKAMVI
ncbi:predicted protein [Plenodomus lingam JN3]|uniref:Predicted protein n=1 Tax=Leptosphaeria maculans (strain JN3 / isolate v23.1.3 / race Av1-4-5-6-7-8) TaxID=985895 RepID=E5A910_LEPMJ|nr:predicted protein [Plenodomus lingam JN3]CBY00105.1 predicted protein [Plenodomus lingam JN3]